jgi:hypothetical protein
VTGGTIETSCAPVAEALAALDGAPLIKAILGQR